MLVTKKSQYYHSGIEEFATSPKQRTKKVYKPKRGLIFAYTVLVVGFAALGIFLTSRYAAIASLGYQIDELKQTVNALETENGRLHLEVAKLKAPNRIEEIATQKLGMQKPTQVAYVSVNQPPAPQAAQGSQGSKPITAAEQSKLSFSQKFTAYYQTVTNWLFSVKKAEAGQLY